MDYEEVWEFEGIGCAIQAGISVFLVERLTKQAGRDRCMH
jgi:hypothetical protein